MCNFHLKCLQIPTVRTRLWHFFTLSVHFFHFLILLPLYRFTSDFPTKVSLCCMPLPPEYFHTLISASNEKLNNTFSHPLALQSVEEDTQVLFLYYRFFKCVLLHSLYPVFPQLPRTVCQN